MDAEKIGPMPESYAIHCIQLKAAVRSDKQNLLMCRKRFFSQHRLQSSTIGFACRA
jgi:hypothetical protein